MDEVAALIVPPMNGAGDEYHKRAARLRSGLCGARAGVPLALLASRRPNSIGSPPLERAETPATSRELQPVKLG